jgi:choline dehydrogenase-like flavoprotein
LESDWLCLAAIVSIDMSTTPIQIEDPIARGLAQGWAVRDGATFAIDETVEADVVIIGTGAGGGMTAEALTSAGLRVVLIEEGPLKSSRDFKLKEAEAYAQLYQESAARKTKDKAINILQGRCVGGSTTVNWTSSFRTPKDTLSHWQSTVGADSMTEAALAPWFEKAETRLNISKWEVPPNENNDLLRRGAEKLKIETGLIKRNVKGCWNIGYCGVGCPTNAKQSMLTTTIPAALTRGAQLFTRMRAQRLVLKGDRAEALLCDALSADGIFPNGKRLTVRAKHFVVAGGAINSPALLMRSGVPNESGLLGKRTFLHPVPAVAARMPNKVEAFFGAPQTVFSDHFLNTQPITGEIGFKLEAPPVHPIIFASTLNGFGNDHARWMNALPYVHVLLALLRDGFHPESVGGTVRLRSDGTPELDYPITDFVWRGMKRALLAMAEIQFSAGASEVVAVHELGTPTKSWAEAKAQIEALPMKPLLTRVVSAHVMGGCAFAGDAKRGVVDQRGRVFGLQNVSVHDGSIFPTSIGANPQLSIYGIVGRMADSLAQTLKTS